MAEQKTSQPESKKGRLIRITDIALTVLILVLVVLVAYIMINASRGRAVSVFGKSILSVVTGSMEPSIHEGDYIIVEKADADDLKKNDIISFYSRDEDIKGRLVTHRIIERYGDGTFLTKGDANETADTERVRPEDIVGKYTGRARLFELIGSFADFKKLIMIFVIIPMALVSLYEVKTLAKLFVQSRQDDKLSQQELKKQLIREEIEKHKELLRREEESSQKTDKEVKDCEPGRDNET